MKTELASLKNCHYERLGFYVTERVSHAWQGQQNDKTDQGEDSEDEDTAFGAGGSAAEDGLAYRVGGEQMVLDHDSAVSDAVEEGLRPVPCCVEADGPPERAGAPEAEAEDDAYQAG